MEKSKVLFGEAESIVAQTRKPLIARRIKQNEKVQKGYKVSRTNTNIVKNQVLPCNRREK